MPVDSFVAWVRAELAGLFPSLQDLPLPDGLLRIDSREIAPGDVFVALNGTRHKGADFIGQAQSRGAVLVLLESDHDEVTQQDGLTLVALSDLRLRLGQWLAAAGQLADPDLHLIGITGTNGKTSVSHYLAELLAMLQQKAAVIGTVGIGSLDALKTSTHTTPDLVQLHRIMADQKQQGYRYQLMEVSSHALDQRRTAGVPFELGIFTNLSRDHLDYHGTMTAYGAAKFQLFDDYPLQRAVLNLDDPKGAEWLAALTHDKPMLSCYSYSLNNTEADLYCRQCEPNSTGFVLTLDGRWGKHRLHLPLLGRFNIANALAAASALMAQGFVPARVVAGLAGLSPVAGRMQRIRSAVLTDGPTLPQIVVDYAHTPDALQNALAAVREHLQGRLWCVFGCGGGRDAGKRPLMAEVASRLADHVVLTSDNPRSEDPQQILDQVAKGLLKPARYIQTDRAEAIHQAVALAAPGDVILVAGKGHETYQEIRGVRHPFDDAEQALSALNARQGELQSL